MITDKKILVIGSGVSGVGAAELLEKAGASPILYDSSEKLKEEEVRSRLPEGSRAEIILGTLPEEVKRETELVILSPGVPVDLPLVEDMRRHGATIWGEVELAWHFGKGKVAAVTGTNGKTTTTTLVGEIFKSWFPKVFVVGNIGTAYTHEALNMTENRIARLFSFHDTDNLDERAFPNDRNFKILQVDEAGNVVFIAYGYISAGRRQGYCGAQVYFYDGSANTVEELAFIPSGKSPEILKAQIDQLAYINGKYELYLFLNDQIFCVHLDSQTVDVTAENLSMDSCSVSESNRMIAWQSGERYASESLILMNLSTGERTEIAAGSGNYILPLGFMGEDIVYGIARQGDVAQDDTGAMVFPMYQIRIQDESGEILMTYEKEGYYVTGCEMRGNQIILSRVERDVQGDFAAAEDDQIVSSQTEAQRTNTIITVPTENDDRLTEIQMRNGVKTGQLKVLTPGEVLYEGSRQVDIPPSQETVELYYVYDPDGEVTFAATPGEAIESAAENAGSVTARGGFYIWRTERLHTSNQIMAIEGTAADEERSSLEVCLDVILTYEGVTRNTGYLMEQGKTVTEILQENLENVQVLDLTGCSLENILYYPDREIPVLALLEDGNAVLITGFNERNVVLMDPQTGRISWMGLNDASAWFEENGNMFVSYVEMQ